MNVSTRPMFTSKHIISTDQFRRRVNNSRTGDRNRQIFLGWVNGKSYRELCEKYGLAMSSVSNILTNCRKAYKDIQVFETQHRQSLEERQREMKADFMKLLKSCSPDAKDSTIKAAADAFIRAHQGCSSFEEALIFATEKELKLIRNAGVKCQAVYANAKRKLNETYDTKDILELKRVIYEAAKELKNYCPPTVERDVLELAKFGIFSIDDFEARGAEILLMPTYPIYYDNDILMAAYTKLTRAKHPDVENPVTAVVYYYDRARPDQYTGLDKDGIDAIKTRLVNEGYAVSVSGRMRSTSIRIICALKKIRGDGK